MGVRIEPSDNRGYDLRNGVTIYCTTIGKNSISYCADEITVDKIFAGNLVNEVIFFLSYDNTRPLENEY